MNPVSAAKVANPADRDQQEKAKYRKDMEMASQSQRNDHQKDSWMVKN